MTQFRRGAFRCTAVLLVCVLVVAGRRDASGRDGSSMTDEEVVKWMEDNPERLDEIMEELTADMREENQLAGHARQVALIQAAKTGNLDDVKFALREGCKLADRSDKNETALHLAAVWGHPHVVEYLIQEGIDVDAEDGHGQSALAPASPSSGFRSSPSRRPSSSTAGPGRRLPLSTRRTGSTPSSTPTAPRTSLPSAPCARTCAGWP